MALSLVFHTLAGLVAGLTINYFSDVLPASRGIARPECPSCGRTLSFHEHLYGKCTGCRQVRSARFSLVMLCSVAASVLLTFYPFADLSFWATLPVMIFLGVILVIDIEHHLVLIETSLVGLGLFLVYGIILRGVPVTILGGLGGLAITLFLYLTGILFSKLVGKLRNKQISEVAFGFGDVFAGTFLGLLVGWPAIIGVVVLAIFGFGAFSVVLILVLLISGRYAAFASAQPFTPFLILATVAIYYLS